MTALLLIFLTAIAVLFAGLGRNRGLLQAVSIAGTGLALAVTVYELAGGDLFGWNMRYASMFAFDTYALAFTATSLITMLLIVGLAGWSMRQLSGTLGDNYGLLFFSLCGALVLFSFTNMTMLFLGIEILSIPLYVLAGSYRDKLTSNEAALKYFLMGAFATGIMLFGMALVYGATATFELTGIARAIAAGAGGSSMLHVGILLIIVGLCFKVSAVPFHFWAPDVYTGSPNLITLFMATIVKTAGFAAFYRLFALAFPDAGAVWTTAIAAIAALTMTLANVTAIFQNDFKRMMAYSSISHAGYLLLAVLVAGQPGSAGAVLLYTFVYSVSTVCAFGAFIAVSEQNFDGTFKAFNGLARRQPWMAAVMAIAMLSLAGIPPTAGFFGKYFLFVSAFEQYPWLVVLAVINSAISIYYYFKVIIAMYFTREEGEYQVQVPGGFAWVMLAGVVLIALLTVMPGSVYDLI
jgi:NADH-quinone oxidoreductase subunit N